MKENKATGYLAYELKLWTGFFKFLFSPLKSYRIATASYFATETLKLVLFSLPLLMIIETSLIHVLISAKFQGWIQIALHVIIILSEIYLCEFLIGNVYYLKDSQVRINDRFFYKVGMLSEVEAKISDIERVESVKREEGEKISNLSLFNEPLTRVYFKREIPYKKLFLQAKMKVGDFFLAEEDLLKLKGLLEGNLEPAVISSGSDPR